MFTLSCVCSQWPRYLLYSGCPCPFPFILNRHGCLETLSNVIMSKLCISFKPKRMSFFVFTLYCRVCYLLLSWCWCPCGFPFISGASYSTTTVAERETGELLRSSRQERKSILWVFVSDRKGKTTVWCRAIFPSQHWLFWSILYFVFGHINMNYCFQSRFSSCPGLAM